MNFSAAPPSDDGRDEEEAFEKVDVEINPIIAEANKGSCFSRKVKLKK